MTKLNKKENQFINDNFGSEEIFRSYCEDRIQMNQIGINKEDPKSDNGKVTTGIVLERYFDQESGTIYLQLLVNNKIRDVVADEFTEYKITHAMESMYDGSSDYTKQEIDELEFLVDKPFLLHIDDEDVVTLIKPLRCDIYDEAFAIYRKFNAA